MSGKELEKKLKEEVKLFKDYKKDYDWLKDGTVKPDWTYFISVEDISEENFKKWVDNKFSVYSSEVRNLLKAMYYSEYSMSETWNCSIGDSFDAKWSTCLSKKDNKKFAVGVAMISLTGKVNNKNKYLNNDDRICKALRYKFYLYKGN
jgi:hypothetical protein